MYMLGTASCGGVKSASNTSGYFSAVLHLCVYATVRMSCEVGKLGRGGMFVVLVLWGGFWCSRSSYRHKRSGVVIPVGNYLLIGVVVNVELPVV